MDSSITSKTSQIHRLESLPLASSSGELLKPSSKPQQPKSPKPNNESGVMSINEQNQQSLREKEKDKETKDVMEFANAWKSQSGLGILMIEKITQIVNSYYKMLPEMAKRQEEIQILIVYNKGLLDILNKFEDHEKKIIIRLKAMEEFNIKIMKELCHIKNKPFKAPEIKNEEPMFGKFNLSELKFERQEPIQQKIDQTYSKKLLELFQQYLLPTNYENALLVQQKISQLSQKEQSLIDKDNLKTFSQLHEKIKSYNEALKQTNEQTMFTLYSMKVSIREELRNLGILKDGIGIGISSQRRNQEEQEKSFVNQVMKLHANLNQMEQGEILNCLRMEKEIHKKLRKQRVKEQEKFLRTCESVQSENTELFKDIQKYKQKISSLENEINVIRAQFDYKKMKIKPNRSSSMVEQSMIAEQDLKSSNRKLVKQTHKAMTYDYKKIKEDNERLQEIVNEYKGKQLSKGIILPKIREKAKKMELIIDPHWEEIRIIEFLLGKFWAMTRQLQPGYETHREDDNLVSPSLDDKNFYGFDVNPTDYIKNNLDEMPQKVQFETEALETRNKELQRQNAELKKKNEENKNMIATKNQDLRRVLEQHQTTLKQTNSKINELVKEYERFQSQIKELKLLNNLLKLKNQFSERLAENVIKSLQQIHVKDFMPQNYEQINSLLVKFQKLIEQYRTETKRQEQNYEEKRQISLIREGDELSSRHGNPNDQSSASLWARTREKRESDMYSIPSKEEDSKSKSRSKVRNIKSLSNDIMNEQELEKELSVRKVFSKKNQSMSPDRSRDSKDRDKGKSREKKEERNDKERQNLLLRKQSMTSDKKNESQQNVKEEQKEEEKLKKMDDFSIDSQGNTYNKNFKVAKKTSSELGLLKKEDIPNDKRMTHTEQNEFHVSEKQKNGSASDQKIIKSQSYPNKNSNSNPKEQQPAKETSHFLSFLDNNHNDYIDSISERPKEVSKQEFKDERNLRKQKQEKKNKVDMNDAMKGSLNLEMFSSRKNRMENIKKSIKEEKKLAREEAENSAAQIKAMEDSSLDKKNSEEKVEESPVKKEEELSEEEKIRINNLLQNQREKQREKELEKERERQRSEQMERQRQIERSREAERLRQRERESSRSRQRAGESQEQSSVNGVTQPMIRINNVTRRQESEQNLSPRNNNRIYYQGSRENERSEMMNNVSMVSSQGRQGQEIPRKRARNREANREASREVQGSMTVERIAQISIEEHERIIARIEKLGDLDDVLDFTQLYNRYKQVLICLDEAQAHNRALQLRYQKFVNELKKKQRTATYSVEQQLFYLRDLVEEQRIQIQDFDRRCNEEMLTNIEKSQNFIKEHLRMMRREYREKQQKQARERKLFI